MSELVPTVDGDVLGKPFLHAVEDRGCPLVVAEVHSSFGLEDLGEDVRLLLVERVKLVGRGPELTGTLLLEDDGVRTRIEHSLAG